MANDLNNFTCTGRLTRDAEQKQLTNSKLTTFDLAINTGFGDNAKVLYLCVNLWGKSGEAVLPYLTKGKMVGVTGSMELQKWTSKADGQDKQKLVLNSTNVVLMGGGSSESKKDNANYEVAEDEQPITW